MSFSKKRQAVTSLQEDDDSDEPLDLSISSQSHRRSNSGETNNGFSWTTNILRTQMEASHISSSTNSIEFISSKPSVIPPEPTVNLAKPKAPVERTQSQPLWRPFPLFESRLSFSEPELSGGINRNQMRPSVIVSPSNRRLVLPASVEVINALACRDDRSNQSSHRAGVINSSACYKTIDQPNVEAASSLAFREETFHQSGETNVSAYEETFAQTSGEDNNDFAYREETFVHTRGEANTSAYRKETFVQTSGSEAINDFAYHEDTFVHTSGEANTSAYRKETFVQTSGEVTVPLTCDQAASADASNSSVCEELDQTSFDEAMKMLTCDETIDLSTALEVLANMDSSNGTGDPNNDYINTVFAESDSLMTDFSASDFGGIVGAGDVAVSKPEFSGRVSSNNNLFSYEASKPQTANPTTKPPRAKTTKPINKPPKTKTIKIMNRCNSLQTYPTYERVTVPSIYSYEAPTTNTATNSFYEPNTSSAASANHIYEPSNTNSTANHGYEPPEVSDNATPYFYDFSASKSLQPSKANTSFPNYFTYESPAPEDQTRGKSNEQSAVDDLPTFTNNQEEILPFAHALLELGNTRRLSASPASPAYYDDGEMSKSYGGIFEQLNISDGHTMPIIPSLEEGDLVGENGQGDQQKNLTSEK